MKKTLPLIAIILALVAYAYAYGVMRPPHSANVKTATTTLAASTSSTNSGTVPGQSPPQKTETITLAVASSTYTVALRTGESVADAMAALAALHEGFSYTAENYPGMGIFVESIDGKKSGDGYDWFLYLNGQSADLGASQTQLHAGDRVEWRFEKDH